MKTIINKIASLLFLCFFTTISMYAQTSEDDGPGTKISDRLYEVYQSSLRGFVGWRTTDNIGGLHIGSTATNSRMVFSIGASVDSDQNSEYMRLYREGATAVLQIGNPNYPSHFDVIQGVTALTFRNKNSSASIMSLRDQNVGIGTETPAYKLDVRGNTQINVGNDQLLVTQRSDGNLQIGNGANRDWYLASNNSGVVKITSAGNIVFMSNKGASWPTISSTNLSKYDIFAARGILAADFALGAASTWADHVFAKDYTLPSLSEVETYIKENGKLPHIPSAEEVAEEGYSLHDMNVKLLEKIEELTLYIIGQDKRISELEKK